MSAASSNSVSAGSNHIFNRHQLEEKNRSPFVVEVDRTAGEISFNIFNSQPMHLLSKAVMYGGLGAIAVVCLPSTIAITIPAVFATFTSIVTLTIPVIPVVTSIAAALFIGEIVSKRKELRYEFSLLYAWSQDQDWWTPIDGSNVVLGAIPLDNHLERLYEEEEIDSFITLLEEFEKKPGLFNPATLNLPDDRHLTINARDFQGVSVEDIQRCVQFIEKKERNGKKVYVHCKSGRGRSAVVVLSYLLKTNYSGHKFGFAIAYESMHSFVKKLRSRINLNANQKAAVQAYYEQYVKGA